MQRPLLYDNPIRQILIKEVYVNQWIYIDGWSFVHFASGFIVGALLKRYFKGFQLYLIAFTVLLLWEIWENMSGQIIFGTEPIVDIIWDMIIGMLGAGLSIYLACRSKKS